ncbi:hypothetical protein [Enhygromyxa salina]|uniref:Tetratricopeptide repeat protein n=1 Tax=Enhygromyxa salina TaxID=215803 RepID=A0A2S9Y7W3_9BACT|nr:hypothetical protein [Enhygromyxa salina]PRQ01185.1 hypothetical protein ENSA7_57900 [Enhygromyxa salina]
MIVRGTLFSIVLCSAPASAPAPVEDPDSVMISAAQQLFLDGQTRYETHDYLGAIEAFTGAYAVAEEIGDPIRRDRALARLRYNLARAHVYAYDVDAAHEHLELARRLMADYRADERAIGKDPDTDTDVKQLEDDLVQREAAHQRAVAHLQGPPPDPINTRRGQTQRRAGISMIALAAPFAGLAVAGGLMGAQANRAFTSVTTEDARTAAQQRGRTGNVLFGVGVGLAVISAASGATLIGLSAKTRRAELSLSATPTGLVLAGEF